ncbi:MAG: SOS response-associated peptidase [Fimbriimonas sp.]|nr:SOS response-associated peptidase [Fimbriimonas sp.]
MCTAGYFASRARAQVDGDVRDFFRTIEELAGIPKTRIRPTNDSPFVRLEEDGQRHLRLLRWGLVPAWSKTEKFPYPTYNARAETVTEKATFREPFRRRRGLMTWISYVEWRDEQGAKIPYEFSLASGEPIAFAGLWDRWGSGDSAFESCTMITCEPNDLAAPYHDRMPVILQPEDFDGWMDPKSDPKDLLALLRPLPAEQMVAVPANPDDFKRPSSKTKKPETAQPPPASLFDF